MFTSRCLTFIHNDYSSSLSQKRFRTAYRLFEACTKGYRNSVLSKAVPMDDKQQEIIKTGATSMWQAVLYEGM